MAQENPPAETAQPDADATVPSGIDGACYNANQAILGPYQLDFCLTRPGTYTADGDGVHCEGRMSWRRAGRTVLGNMHPTSCGAVSFQGAQLDCRPQSTDPAQGTEVPADVLGCVLYPANPGQKRQVFDASLQNTQ